MTQKEINNYIARQQSWIKANNIKIGQTVFILRTHKSAIKGWNNTWEEDMLPLNTGKIFKFKNENGISVDITENKRIFNYPYTILLPLQGKPEDYEIKPFFWRKDKHYALVTENVEESDFFLKENFEDDTYVLRKNIKSKVTVSKFYDIVNNKGYWPSIKKYCSNSVVASTLKGIWLPTMDIPK